MLTQDEVTRIEEWVKTSPKCNHRDAAFHMGRITRALDCNKRLSYGSDGSVSIHFLQMSKEVEKWAADNGIIGFRTTQQSHYQLFLRPDDYEHATVLTLFEHPQLGSSDSVINQRSKVKAKGKLLDNQLITELEILIKPTLDSMLPY